MNARERILNYLKLHVGQVIDETELSASYLKCFEGRVGNYRDFLSAIANSPSGYAPSIPIQYSIFWAQRSIRLLFCGNSGGGDCTEGLLKGCWFVRFAVIGKSVKTLMAFVLLFSLCLTGLTGAAHAVENTDYARHDALVKHADQSQADQQKSTSTDVKGHCEMACHIGFMANSPVHTHGQVLAVAAQDGVPHSEAFIASLASATPDQPPRLS